MIKNIQFILSLMYKQAEYYQDFSLVKLNAIYQSTIKDWQSKYKNTIKFANKRGRNFKEKISSSKLGSSLFYGKKAINITNIPGNPLYSRICPKKWK